MQINVLILYDKLLPLMTLKFNQTYFTDRLIKKVSLPKLLIGIGGLLTIVILDLFLWRTRIIQEGLPDLTLGHLLRSMIIGLSVLIIVVACLEAKPSLLLTKANGKLRQVFSIIGIQLLSMFILCLFFYSSSIFNAVSLEDSILEWSSFLAWFSGCIVFLITLVKLPKAYHSKKMTSFFLVGLVVVFFILAMEEVSWFQRILGIRRSMFIFRWNEQGEINIHNFATNLSEVTFYFGSFLLMVVIPFICILFCNQYQNYSWYVFIPRPFMIIIGAFACAYNFDMWNIIFTQIAFWGALIITVVIFLFSQKRRDKLLALVSAIILVVSQVSFLLNGQIFVLNIFVITEYKEFLIALGALIYALDVSFILENKLVKNQPAK